MFNETEQEYLSKKRVDTWILVITAIVLCFLVWTLVGCSKDPYALAVTLVDDLAKATHEGALSADDLRKNGLITVPEEQNVLNLLDRIDDFGKAYLISVNRIHADYVACEAQGKKTCAQVQLYLLAADDLLVQLSRADFLASIRVVNPNAQTRVDTIIAAIRAVVNGARLALVQIKGA